MKNIFLSTLIIGLIIGCSQEGNSGNIKAKKTPSSKSFFAFCERLEEYGKDYRKDMAPGIAKMILLEEDGIEDSSSFINEFEAAVAMGNLGEALANANNAFGSFGNDYYQEKSTTGSFEAKCSKHLLETSFEETPQEWVEKTP